MNYDYTTTETEDDIMSEIFQTEADNDTFDSRRHYHAATQT
jgi:hypothetical protein